MCWSCWRCLESRTRALCCWGQVDWLWGVFPCEPVPAMLCRTDLFVDSGHRPPRRRFRSRIAPCISNSDHMPSNDPCEQVTSTCKGSFLDCELNQSSKKACHYYVGGAEPITGNEPRLSLATLWCQKGVLVGGDKSLRSDLYGSFIMRYNAASIQTNRTEVF